MNIKKIPKYGFFGVLLIFLGVFLVFYKIPFVSDLYFFVFWVGYIITVNSIVHSIRNESLMANHFFEFLKLIFFSVVFWWIFELINIFTKNWTYTGFYEYSSVQSFFIMSAWYAVILPAIMETVDLIRSLPFSQKFKLNFRINATNGLCAASVLIGFLSLGLIFVIPSYFFPFLWISFFFLLDPINYMGNRPSVIEYLQNGEWRVPISLMISGLIFGTLSQFLNFWAPARLIFDIQFLGFLKILGMPILGYLAFLPFALELYSMYHFVSLSETSYLNFRT